MRRWLMKSEPSVYSIEDLAHDGQTLWTGIRNYQARNFMMKDMAPGDPVLFYHSNAAPPGIAGLMQVCGPARPDPTQFEAGEAHEPRASLAHPVWHCVEVRFVKQAERYLSLDALRGVPALADMLLLQKGSRLSIQPVEAAAFARIVKLAGL